MEAALANAEFCFDAECIDSDGNGRFFTREQNISLATEPWKQVTDELKQS